MIRLGIDIGGTFTDLVAIDDTGAVRTHKIASAPGDYAGPILAGIAALGFADGGLVDPGAIGDLRHATTIGSNTVLEGKGARTALITTDGFRDILEIRDLRMPVLYDMRWTKPAPLVPRRLRFTVIEKLRPDGGIAVPLDQASLDAAIDAIAAAGVESVAVSLLHAYANPAHELAVGAALAARLPDVAVSLSHAILPEIKEYPRTSTTVVNAYVQPVIRAYLVGLIARLREIGITASLRLMQSHGGLAGAAFAAEQPARIVESGPAAGVVGGAAIATRLGEPLLITFDMGGTTAKAGLVEQGEVLRAEALELGAGVLAGARLLVGAGYMLKLPAIDLAEVGAGGGSICRLDAAGAPKIGPDSAGADPGPVCYGRGGVQPTITDCNLALGYLDPAGLAGGALTLDRAAARAAIEKTLAIPMGLSVEEAAAGMLRLASASMMRAIRAVSVERGRDARGAAMLAFGGNGPLFATAIAEALGIARVLIPPMPGLFSALGLLLADPEHHASRSLRLRLDPALPAPDAAPLAAVLAGLRTEAEAVLAAEGIAPERRDFRFAVAARYAGQSSEIAVARPPLDPAAPARALLAALPGLFAAEHARTYGFSAPAEEPVELIAVALRARGLGSVPPLPSLQPGALATETARQVWFAEGGWRPVPVLARGHLTSAPRPGPLIVQEYDATALVPAGWNAALDPAGLIRVKRQSAGTVPGANPVNAA